MKSVARTLNDADPALLPILAKRWDVDIQHLTRPEIYKRLGVAMTDPERAEKVWASLDDEQRGALQALVGSGGKMAATMFKRLFGDIRQMGALEIEREKPHINPSNSAEALYYRGLIAQGFEQAESGARAVIYVPDELMSILPRKTGYDDLKDALLPAGDTERTIEPVGNVQNIRQADTSIVDDMTTLLAYLQISGGTDVEGETLAAPAVDALMPHLLTEGEARLAFLLGVGISAELIEVDAAAGKAFPKRADIRRWLAGTRSAQVKSLAEAWRASATYRDLWHVSGLHPEPTGWPYDPVIARSAVIHFLSDIVPEQDWWALEDFIETIKENDPDFQRPDYTSWYIRNDAGDYLQGFESWDAVEGALLEYYINGPMHWLGLVDLADDAARLTAYGRAFIGIIPWPSPPETEGKITVQEDGTLIVPRRVPRMDRFQIARFASWVAAGDPYEYKLDAEGVARASQQGINTGHIAAFIARAVDPIPPRIAQLLESWKGGPTATVSLEHLVVLRTSAPETLKFILDKPALRRYLGAQLGPMAVIVREPLPLREALAEHGIQAELIGL